MLKDVLLEYGAPIAVSATLAVGGMAISNSERIAVVETETKNVIQIEQQTLREVRELTVIVARIEGKLETHNTIHEGERTDE
jgi:hypothetical protein